jgi:hypothetical protein
MLRVLALSVCALLLVVPGIEGAHALGSVVLELAPGQGNPRNSEGDFITLKDGRILFVYSHFTGGIEDDASAYLASRVSSDEGRTWSAEDKMEVAKEGAFNIMSVSMLRLGADEIGLFYLRKESDGDCRGYLRRSSDEGKTWNEPTLCMPEMGYYVVNNARIVRTRDGRIVIPTAWHTPTSPLFKERASALCYLSDDNGKSWRRSKTILEAPPESRTGLQEPGVIELKDGRLLMLCRTDLGCQLRSFSTDGGDTWSPVERSDLLSPVSPATLARIPTTGDLAVLWNDHSAIDPTLKAKRTPFTLALSKDEGTIWDRRINLEDLPTGWYCYTAVHFTKDAMLLGYCAGDTRQENGLARTRIRRIEFSELP